MSASGLQEEDIHTDFDDVLNQATEEELVDLAGRWGAGSATSRSVCGRIGGRSSLIGPLNLLEYILYTRP